MERSFVMVGTGSRGGRGASLAALTLLLLLAGCDDDGGADGGTLDAAGRDGGERPLDGGEPPDAGTGDAGPRVDGGASACTPALPTFADGLTPERTLHVAPGGSGDGSAGSPFGSLQAALAAATPGTEVRVDGDLPASTYTTGLAGTETAPIWITGEAGARIGPLTLEDASYIVVRDLELAGSPDGHVLHFFFSNDLVLRRLRIHDAGLGCIKGSQSVRVDLSDSELWDAGNRSDHPVLDYVGVNGARIVRSRFHEGPGVMVMLKGGTSDLFFAWNEIYDQTSPGNALALGQSTGPQFFQPIDSRFEGVRILAFANLLHDLVGAPVAFEGCQDCAAVHNTIWNTTGGQLLRFLPGAAGQDSGETRSVSEGCRFTGNIVVGGQAGGASLNADMDNVGPNNVADYNVWLKPGSLNWWGVVPQDMASSTYDQDPRLTAEGLPQETSLVAGAGPPDLSGLPFSELMVQGYDGACFTAPSDLGARVLP